jgi:3-deoxy-D-arabino-heptulosonate 7-phosphate (DAHP) synthase
LLIEVDINPDAALCDKEQTLRPEQFAALMRKIEGLHQFLTEAG